MQKTREVNHFFLIDKSRSKQYRFSYEKEFTVDEKLKWRERWLKGELAFECGCGKPFAINRAGSIYYPANGEEAKSHATYCKRGKSASSGTGESGNPVKRWIVLHVPAIPVQAARWFDAVDEERLLAERLVDPYPMTQMGSLKHKTGRKWVEVNGKTVHMNSLLVETTPELKLKKAGEDALLLIRPIDSLEEERYGFVKVNLLDVDGKVFSVWVKGDMIRAMQQRSGIDADEMLPGDDLSERFWLSGIGYIREEKWKNGVFRKLYLIRGGLLQVRWN